jgi:hypothetical protein
MLGYGAAEWGLLSTELGHWIMPELRIEKQAIRKSIYDFATQGLKQEIKETATSMNGLAKAEKASLVKKILKWG